MKNENRFGVVIQDLEKQNKMMKNHLENIQSELEKVLRHNE